jgi:fermentation-respiration switch protein FrsA (DUF1100 family)
MKNPWIFSFCCLVPLVAGCSRLENKHIFFPAKEFLLTPETRGLPYEDVNFNTEDNIKINGWYIKTAHEAPTVLFLHGNAGNISHRLDKLQMFHRSGLNVLIIDYRGYGKSEGNPSEEGVYLDALAAYDYLKIRIGEEESEQLILYGESLGGAIAVDLATKRGVRSIILDSTFTSIADMAQTRFPLIPSFMIKTRMDSLSKISQITCPLLLIHSLQDEIVPFQLGERLYAASPTREKFFLKIRGGHNSGFQQSQKGIEKGVVDFLRSIGYPLAPQSIQEKKDFPRIL